ncbi:MAG: L-histidine N(alpha)-methyltransferase [Gemmatimonadota bacterium]
MIDPVMLQDVLEGLELPQKELSPKYFYDATGSELFERITELDEYYPTRTERALLEEQAPKWVRELRPASLVELGAGSSEKSRVVLSAMEDAGTGNVYVPVDVSGEFLHETARKLRLEYEGFRVEPEVVDISAPFDLPSDLPGPTWIALLGSTIGNFAPTDAVRLLKRVRSHLAPDDRFLLGVDRRPGPGKSVERLERAYNDDSGVTAAFNLNVLRVLNRELGADFDLDAFEHRAIYEPTHQRIEMHLVAQRPQEVTIGESRIRFEKGESIRTELSCKHDRASVDSMLEAADMEVERWAEDAEGAFTLLLAAPVEPGKG